MIRIGIVGSNYGRTVLLPAFRADPRCEVVALAGSDAARTRGLAEAAGVAKAYGDWRRWSRTRQIDAVAIATRPDLQPRSRSQRSSRQAGVRRKADGERPCRRTRHARGGARQAASAGDDRFQLHQIAAWQRAKEMLDGGADRRVAACRGTLERREPRHADAPAELEDRRATTAAACSAISSRTVSIISSGSADRSRPCRRGLAACPMTRRWKRRRRWRSRLPAGAAGSLSMSCASYLGSGHRLEFYGEDGTLVLNNPDADYMRGFELVHARRPAAALARVAVDDPADAQYPRRPHRAGVAAGQRLPRRDRDTASRRRPASPKAIACSS